MIPGPALVLAQDAAEPGSVLRSGGNCLEVAKARNQVLIHNGKNTHGPVLTIPLAAWRQLTRQHSAEAC